jgi:DNA (cytosine-5)-methyltransferase 1
VKKLRALDLFCKAGGATRGLQRADIHVTGVDIKPQPRYCGDDFVWGDVLQFPIGWLRTFDFIWASPPCQKYTALKTMPTAKEHVDLIPLTRRLLKMSGVPYVIENVEGAPLVDPVWLCGCMFNLGAQGCRLERKRGFEASFSLIAPPHRHDARPVIGVYGGHARRRAASAGGRGTRDVWDGGHLAAASQALGIDWMTLDELSEAVPPAYALFIGQQFLATRQSATA